MGDINFYFRFFLKFILSIYWDRNPKEKLVKIPVPKFVFIISILGLKFMVTVRNTIKTHFINLPRRDFFSF